MKDYFNLWIKFGCGLISGIVAIIFPVIFLLFEVLPYSFTCLINGHRLKKGYKYLYFLPRFVKELRNLKYNK